MDVLDDAPCGEDDVPCGEEDVPCEEEDIRCGEEDIACGVSSGEGRFSYSVIHAYLRGGSYPAGFTKADKLALRKRDKFFIAKDCELYYVGGATKTSKKPVQ